MSFYFRISMVVLGGGLDGLITLYRYGTLPRSLPFWAQASRDSVSGNYFSHPRPPSEVYTFTHNSTTDMVLMTYLRIVYTYSRFSSMYCPIFRVMHPRCIPCNVANVLSCDTLLPEEYIWTSESILDLFGMAATLVHPLLLT